ncbi:MAG: tetratricopeptide repeat protein [bacterium]
MRNLIPSYIEKKCSVGIYKGSFIASAIFVDISGFTAMTENLMSYGKEGGEEISKFLNAVFTPLICEIYRNGGFVTTFAGDAFTAVFPDTSTEKACKIAGAAQKEFKKVSYFKSELGDFSLSLKIGVSHGDVSWGIIGDNEKQTYFFKGQAIDECIFAESKCKGGEMCVKRDLLPADNVDIDMSEPIDGYSIFTCTGKLVPAENDFVSPHLSGGTSGHFFSDELYNSDISGEFRSVVSVFISFREPESYKDLEIFVQKTLKITDMTGGYFNLLDFGDKGAEIFVIFGAPKSFENNAFRSMNFMELMQEQTDVPFRAGITEGIVYAGFVGSNIRSTYTVLGDKVNLAARMMMSARWGEIHLHEDVEKNINVFFSTSFVRHCTFKGKTEKTAVYRLHERKEKAADINYDTVMVGREDEKKEILNFLKPIEKRKNAGVCSVLGEAGIGKTRLVSEVAKFKAKKFNFFYISADTVIKRSLNPFTNLIEKYFRKINPENNIADKSFFDHAWKNLTEAVNKTQDHRSTYISSELERTKSFIAAMLNIFWKGSLYDRLQYNKKVRFENTVTAVREFLKGISLLEPLLLIFDDVHEMDNDSLNVISQLAQQLSDYPVAIILSGRLKDDGTKPDIKVPAKYLKREILLRRLAKKTTGDFIKLNLGTSGGSSLVNFLNENTNRNPFFMEQMLMYLQENGFLEIKNELFELKSVDVDIPTKINSLLVSRIDRLSSDLKKFVFAASVIGREFYVDILRKLIDDKNPSGYLSKGEIERIWNRDTASHFVFRNTMLRDTAYNMQLQSRLRIMHKKIAELFIKTFKNDARFYSNIALHFEEACKTDAAREYYLKAADFAESQYQNNDAVNFYEKVLSFKNTETEAISIMSNLASVYKRVGKWDSAEKYFAKAVEISEKLFEEPLIAENIKNMGHFLLEKGEYKKAFTMLEKAKAVFLKRKDMNGLCQVEGYIGLYYYYRGELDSALSQFKRRLSIAEKIEDTEELALTYRWFGGVSFYRSDYEQALSYYKKNLSLVRKTENEMDVAVAYNNLGLCYSHLNDLENALKYYNKALELFEKFGSRQYIAHTMYNTAELYFLKGEFIKARELLLRQLQIAEELGNKRSVAMTNNMLGCILKKTGRFEKAAEYISKAVKIADNKNLKNLLCEFQYELADAFYELKQYEKSEKINEKAYKIANEVHRNEFLFASELLKAKLFAAKTPEKAIEHFSKMLKLYKDDYHIAEIHFWIYQTSKQNKHRIEALKYFKKLYEEGGKHHFKERLDLLSE